MIPIEGIEERISYIQEGKADITGGVVHGD
jgi:hypothetical protein